MKRLLMSVGVGLATIAPVWAEDAALITVLQGEALVESGKGSKRTAIPFLKLSAGEKLHMRSANKVQVVYFANGRQETWSGTGVVQVDPTEGRSGSLKPEVKQLPAVMVKQIAKTPAAGEHGRAGMVVMRSLPSTAKTEQLGRQYADFRKDAAADDLTPEMFYLSGLVELKEFSKAKEVLAKLRTHSGNPAAQDLVDYYTPLVEPAGK